MPINFANADAVVVDVAGVDDAEALLEWLQCRPQGGVDLSACSHLHASCLQALMVARARITAWPVETALAACLKDVLDITKEETATP